MNFILSFPWDVKKRRDSMLFKTKWFVVMHTSAIGGTRSPGPREINQMSHLLLRENTTVKGKMSVWPQYDLLPWWSWLSSGWWWLSHSLMSKLDGLRTLKVKNIGGGSVGREKAYLHTSHIFTMEWGYLFHPLGNVIGKLESLVSCPALPLLSYPGLLFASWPSGSQLSHTSSLSYGKKTEAFHQEARGGLQFTCYFFPCSLKHSFLREACYLSHCFSWYFLWLSLVLTSCETSHGP